jgi:hypothetical protein
MGVRRELAAAREKELQEQREGNNIIALRLLYMLMNGGSSEPVLRRGLCHEVSG